LVVKYLQIIEFLWCSLACYDPNQQASKVMNLQRSKTP
jgi:hypothetical protein